MEYIFGKQKNQHYIFWVMNDVILILVNGCKSKRKIWKKRYVENKYKSKKYTLWGQRNVRYHDRILSNTKKAYTLT